MSIEPAVELREPHFAELVMPDGTYDHVIKVWSAPVEASLTAAPLDPLVVTWTALRFLKPYRAKGTTDFMARGQLDIEYLSMLTPRERRLNYAHHAARITGLSVATPNPAVGDYGRGMREVLLRSALHQLHPKDVVTWQVPADDPQQLAWAERLGFGPVAETGLSPGQEGQVALRGVVKVVRRAARRSAHNMPWLYLFPAKCHYAAGKK